jgi:transcription elongation factor GreA
MVTQIPITEEGLEKLKEQLKRLKSVDRPQIIEAIAEARALGDLSENAEYHSAREKQGFIEGRIQELEDKVTRCQVIFPPQSGKSERVVFGARVKIKDVSDESKGELKVYRIVGDLEADIKVLSISVSSPLAKSLLNKAVGDIVTVNLPKGEREYEVVSISF